MGMVQGEIKNGGFKMNGKDHTGAIFVVKRRII